MNAGLLLMLGGTLLSAGSSAYGAGLSIKQGKYSQDVLEAQAKYLQAAYKIDEAKIELDKKRTLSSQKAQTAASGIRTDVGAPVEVAAETERMADIDKNILRISGGIDSLRLQTQGQLARAQGYAAGATQYAQGAGSLLSTAMAYGQRSGWFDSKPGSGKQIPYIPGK